MKGTVKWYSDQKGFGFIKPDEGDKDLFFHRTNVKTPNHSLIEGQRVEFEVTKGPKGPEATDVRLGE
jgi:cold shock protein